MITSGYSLSLSNERKRFQEKIALVWRVDGDAFGGIQWPTSHIRQHIHKNATVKPCLLCGMFGARSSLGTNHSFPGKECVTVVDAWGTCGDRECCSGWWYRVIRRNTFSRTSREIEVLLDHLDELGATVQTHLRRRSPR